MQEDGWRERWVTGGWTSGNNSMQILGKLCFREQGLRLTGVTFPTTKPLREGYET